MVKGKDGVCSERGRERTERTDVRGVPFETTTHGESVTL